MNFSTLADLGIALADAADACDLRAVRAAAQLALAVATADPSPQEVERLARALRCVAPGVAADLDAWAERGCPHA